MFEIIFIILGRTHYIKNITRCPECDETLDDESYCYNCGWPNSHGWIVEHYR